MEQDLWCLRHARNGFDAEVSEGGNVPRVEISRNEITTSFGGDKGIEHELGTTRNQNFELKSGK